MTSQSVELFGEDWNSFEGQLEKPVDAGTARRPVGTVGQNAVLTVTDRLRGSP